MLEKSLIFDRQDGPNDMRRDLRERYLGTAEPQSPSRLREAIEAAGEGVVLFHPFLLDDEARVAVLRDVLGRARGAVPCRDLVG